MQKYLADYSLYGFNRQKAFGAGYIAKNFPASQKDQIQNKSNMEYRSNVLVKS